MIASKPNILFLITDQQQKATVDSGCACAMPNLQAIAADGIRFERAHASNAICSPSRASLMTGLLPHNHGMVDCTHTVEPYRADYDSKRDTLTRLLQREGYSLGYFGKWHIERTHRLEDYGFTDYATERSIPAYTKTPVEACYIKNEGYSDQLLYGTFSEGPEATEEHFLYSKAIDFIEKRKGSDPWCVFVSTYAPHDPYVAPDSIFRQYDPASIPLPASYGDAMSDKPTIYRRIRDSLSGLTEMDYRKAIACYYASCSSIDFQVGRIVDYLKKIGEYENTIIVYTSDHGDLMGAHGMMCKGVPAFEEAYSIPLIIRHPRRMKGIVSDVHLSTHDIAPTLLELAGLPPLEDIDGSSAVPYLDGGNREPHVAFAEFHGQRFFYTQRILWKDSLKYVFNGFDRDELYDLANDPNELVNLAENQAYADTAKSLMREIWRIASESGDRNFSDSEYVMFRFAPEGPKKKKKEASVYNKTF